MVLEPRTCVRCFLAQTCGKYAILHHQLPCKCLYSAGEQRSQQLLLLSSAENWVPAFPACMPSPSCILNTAALLWPSRCHGSGLSESLAASKKATTKRSRSRINNAQPSGLQAKAEARNAGTGSFTDVMPCTEYPTNQPPEHPVHVHAPHTRTPTHVRTHS